MIKPLTVESGEVLHRNEISLLPIRPFDRAVIVEAPFPLIKASQRIKLVQL